MSDETHDAPAGPQGKGARRLIVAAASLLTLASIAFAFQLYRNVLGLLLYNEQFLSGMLGLGMALVYLTQPARRGTSKPAISWYDWLLAALSVIVGIVIAVRFPALSEDMTSRPLRRLDYRLRHRPAGDRGTAPQRRPRAHHRRRRLSRLRTAWPIRAGRARRPAGRYPAAGLLSGVGSRQHARPAADGGDHHRHRLRFLRAIAICLRRLGVFHRHRAYLDGPLSRRLGQDRGDRLLPVRHDLGQRGEQRRLRRRADDPADAARRLSRPRRRGNRSGRLDRRPAHAAGDGRRRLPDGGIPAGAISRRGDRRHAAGAALLLCAVHPGRSDGGGQRLHPCRRHADSAHRQGVDARAGIS